MKSTGELQGWLPWLMKVQFVILCYILNLFFLIYNRMSVDHSLQAYWIVFRDTAIGMMLSQPEKVFKRFQPAFTQGTRLGLVTLYQIVQGNSGHIQTDSSPGRGTELTIEPPKMQPVEKTDEARIRA